MSRRYYGFLNRQSAVLGCFALLTGSVLWVANLITAPKIELNEDAVLIRTLNDVLPSIHHDNNLLNSPIVIYDSVSQIDRTIYPAFKNKTPSAAVISAIAPDGYAAEISLLVGILIDGTISGVRILQHQETPGLGDDIELRKSEWILEFNGKTITTPRHWAVVRDGGSFDQFTGATITPRAVVRAVNQTLHFFQKNKRGIFTTINEQ